MHYNPNILCAYFANNTYLVSVHKRGAVTTNIWKPGNVQSYSFDLSVPATDLVPIGYIKTRTECISMKTFPYELMYSPTLQHIYLHGNWIPLSCQPRIGTEHVKYRDLLTNDDAECIFYDTDGNVHFL